MKFILKLYGKKKLTYNINVIVLFILLYKIIGRYSQFPFQKY